MEEKKPDAPKGCKHCGHLIGYHNDAGDKCTCKDCKCPGYESWDKEAFSKDEN